MKAPYNHIIDYHLEKDGMDYTDDVNHMMIVREMYIQRLETNRLLKWQRDELILLLKLLS